MRNSARAVIIQNNKILTIFRRKIKENKVVEYYVIPGGGVEENETLTQTVIRELKEELNVDIKILGYLGKDSQSQGFADYFHCEILNNQIPKLGGEELDRMTSENYYEPMFIDINNLDNIDINGKEFIYKALKKEYKK